MYIISTIYKVLVNALFPLSKAERELFLLQPEQAYEKLPPAPGYEGLAVALPDSSSIFAYKDERVAKLVWNIKYKKSSQAVKIGGYALWKKIQTIATEMVMDGVVIIPMPITNRRRKERGYNQCELLIDEIERLNLAGQNFPKFKFKFEKNLLIRTHHASRQTLKGRDDRLDSAKGIFGVNESAVERLRTQLSKDQSSKNSTTTKVEKMPVIIIDDVITTGSTMFEAIETLKKAGFEDVRGLSLAH